MGSTKEAKKKKDKKKRKEKLKEDKSGKKRKRHEEKEKKKSSKKRKRERDGKDMENEPDIQKKALLELLDSHPEVPAELVLVLRALEAGQGVALDGLPNPEMRKRMGKLLDSMGSRLRTELSGLAASTTFYLDEEPGAASDAPLLRTMQQLITALLGPAPDVDDAQDKIDDLLEAFPPLKEEVPGLLGRVASREAVIIGGLEDEALKAGLRSVFRALRLEEVGVEGEEEEGYRLLKGPAGMAQREKVRELLRLNTGGGKAGEEDDEGDEALWDDEEEDEAGEDMGADGGEGAEADAATEGGGAAVEGAPEGGQQEVKRVAGPAMPDAALLAQAQAMKEQMALEGLEKEEEEEEDDDDDDLIGPSLGDNRQAVSDDVAYRHLALKAAREESAREGATRDGGEDWLAAAIGKQSLARNLAPSMKSRAFQQRSKRALLANAKEPSMPKTAAQWAELKQEEESRAKTKTLLEKHQEKINKEKQAAGPKPVVSKPWNREEMMEGRQQMDRHKAAELFQHAKELSTRFSRTFK